MAKKKEERPMRIPSLVATEHGYAVNKWCGSCKFKEILAHNGAEGIRWCGVVGHEIDVDDICPEYQMNEAIARL